MHSDLHTSTGTVPLTPALRLIHLLPFLHVFQGASAALLGHPVPGLDAVSAENVQYCPTTFRVQNTEGMLCSSVIAAMKSKGEPVCVEGTLSSYPDHIVGGPSKNDSFVVSENAACIRYATVASSTACIDISEKSQISITQLESLNAGLNCWGLKQNQTLCIELGAVPPASSAVSISSTTSTSTLSTISNSSTSSSTASGSSSQSTVRAASSSSSPDAQPTSSPAPQASPSPAPQPSPSPPQPQPSPSPEPQPAPSPAAQPSPSPAPQQPAPSPVAQPSPVPQPAPSPAPIVIPVQQGKGPGSGGVFDVSWHWFQGNSLDCDGSITAEQYNTGFYAGAQDIPALCGQKATFVYNGNSVTVTYAWMTGGGFAYHELSAQAFAQLIGSNAKASSAMRSEDFQKAINDPGRVNAVCNGPC
ncbi:hypothetical protein BJ741DRAFT_610470 [Chytriomyces cf. hyalinus JEL632]|nr:hypothetical protein BJ741DRAFT_610470 [Chytriomyces cf. hyalinus JEL632]